MAEVSKEVKDLVAVLERRSVSAAMNCRYESVLPEDKIVYLDDVIAVCNELKAEVVK